MPNISADQKRWREEDDARILAQAEEIKQDTKRLKAAARRADTLAKEQEKSIQSMKKVAATKKSTPAAAKKSTPAAAKKSTPAAAKKRAK